MDCQQQYKVTQLIALGTHEAKKKADHFLSNKEKKSFMTRITDKPGSFYCFRFLKQLWSSLAEYPFPTRL